jgi:hypothetical protein
MTPQTKYGKWLAEHGCTTCMLKLSQHDICFSHGVCPECGHKTGDTILSHFTVSTRWVWEEVPFLWIFKRKINKRKEVKEKWPK